jgi:1,4-alpha-glucan branching enzyme
MASPFSWWYPVGGQLHDRGAAFRVWADGRKSVSVVINKNEHKLTPEPDGYFSGFVPNVREGETYTFQVDGDGPLADPASRSTNFTLAPLLAKVPIAPPSPNSPLSRN